MNICRIILASCLLQFCFFVAPDQALAQRKKTPVSKATTANGTTTLDELGQVVHQSIQDNNFELLNSYFPSEHDLKQMQEKGSPDMRAMLELMNAEELQGSFKEDYDRVISKGVDGMLNWSDMQLTEVSRGKVNPKNPNLIPVEIRLSDKYNRNCSIKFNAIKNQNRYLIFQHLLLNCQPPAE